MFSSRISRKLGPTKNSARYRQRRGARWSRRGSAAGRCGRRRRRRPPRGDGRHEERQDQQADRGVELVELTTMTVSPKRTMLPPIWVAAWDSQRRRNGRCGRRRARRRRLRRPLLAVSRPPSRADRSSRVAVGAAERAAVSAGSPRVTKPASRRSRVRRSSSTWRPQVWQRRPMSAPSRSTSQVSPPHGCVRRKPHDVAEQQGEDGLVGIGGSGYQSRGWPSAGTSVPVVAGSSIRSTGVTVTTTPAGSRPAGR